jgi:hypothetical protein
LWTLHTTWEGVGTSWRQKDSGMKEDRLYRDTFTWNKRKKEIKKGLNNKIERKKKKKTGKKEKKHTPSIIPYGWLRNGSKHNWETTCGIFLSFTKKHIIRVLELISSDREKNKGDEN